MATVGQQQALHELARVAAAAPGAVTVEGEREDGSTVAVRVGVDCRGFERVAGGIRLRQREWFDVLIPASFPWVPPSVWARHARWAGTPHVQWRRYLCLYRAPGVEWNPSDGMFGFLGRLVDWLERAALDQLDPIGGPVHPPVAYSKAGTPLIVPRSDTPAFSGSFWWGWAEFDKVSAVRHDIVGWHPVGASGLPSADRLGPAVLLAGVLPFEYPKRLGDLVEALGAIGFDWDRLYRLLAVSAFGCPDDVPLAVVVGTPMRGIRGDDPKQHLAVWQLPGDKVGLFRAMLPKESDTDEIERLRTELVELMKKWAGGADVHWCAVREARPEVTADRGEGSPMQWFAGKSVAVWGCGALGSHIAEQLARVGAGRIILRDKSTVSPGILTRQCFDDADIGHSKAVALRSRLLRIRPQLDVEALTTDLLIDEALDRDWTDGADVVIDASANGSVTKRLEQRRQAGDRRAPVATMVVGHTAEHSLLTFTPPDGGGGPADTARKAKLVCLRQPRLDPFAKEFWPDPPRTPAFQPEPGCSEPTFTGTGTEVAALASGMLLALSRELADDTPCPTAVFETLIGSRPGVGATERVAFDQSDLVLPDNYCGFQVRVAAPAAAEMWAWTRRMERTRPGAETGGILFGERDDALKIMWVTDLLGPPPDSRATADGFVCGTLGVDQAAMAIAVRSRGSSKALGMWHTHPDSVPAPSPTDHGGMRQLVGDDSRPLPKQLLLVVGGRSGSATLGAYVYDRDRPPPCAAKVLIRQLPHPAAPNHRIGLALSGGGSRAIAFHLGVMRALRDRGVLDHINVISAVSGGSVLAAMWAYTDQSFERFDQRVTELLRSGLTPDIARAALLTRRAPQSIATTAIAGFGKVAATGATLGGRLWHRLRGLPAHRAVEPPFRRWVSRSTAFEDVLSCLFDDVTINKPARNVAVVINACELRGGNAFRFGSVESGSSRFGRLADNAVPVARAVAASAAYPVVFPAFDRRATFIGWDGHERVERVILTDGGVYDNLGLTCLEPNRSAEHSTNVHPTDFIISCDAGQGVLEVDTWPLWWPSRLKRSFESVYRKVQDAGKGLLHEHRRSGAIKGFAMPFLGMNDSALFISPPDLVPRDAVVRYPTNFSPMSEENLALLAGRGEQLTRLLIEHHCPDIVA